MAGVFTVAMLASIGVPGLNGFVGEFLVLIGTFVAHRWWAVAATVGVIVAAIYLLWAYQQVFHGQPTEEDTKTRDLGWSERLIVAPLIVLIVALGRVPEAGARPDHPVGQPTGHPRRPGHPHPGAVQPVPRRPGLRRHRAAAPAHSGHGALSALAVPPGRDDPARPGPTSAGGAP